MIGTVVRVNQVGYGNWPNLKGLPTGVAVVVKINTYDKGIVRMLVQFPFSHSTLHEGKDYTHYPPKRFSNVKDCYWMYPEEVDIVSQPTPLSYEEMM